MSDLLRIAVSKLLLHFEGLINRGQYDSARFSRTFLLLEAQHIPLSSSIDWSDRVLVRPVPCQ